jgi:carboxyl-terminal processing protease
MGTRKLRSFGLVSAGIVAGVLLSLGISAVAQRGSPLPLDELRPIFKCVLGNQK